MRGVLVVHRGAAPLRWGCVHVIHVPNRTGKDLEMRTPRLYGLLIALLMTVCVTPTLALAQSERKSASGQMLPVTHPVVGSWRATVGLQSGRITFADDGTVHMSLAPLQYDDPGMVNSGPASGTWEAIGETGAMFTVVQQFWTKRGERLLGTATITGFVAIDCSGDRLIDDGALTTIILRDAEGHIGSVRAATATTPYLSATRVVDDAPTTLTAPMPQGQVGSAQGSAGSATCG